MRYHADRAREFLDPRECPRGRAVFFVSNEELPPPPPGECLKVTRRGNDGYDSVVSREIRFPFRIIHKDLRNNGSLDAPRLDQPGDDEDPGLPRCSESNGGGIVTIRRIKYTT